MIWITPVSAGNTSYTRRNGTGLDRAGACRAMRAAGTVISTAAIGARRVSVGATAVITGIARPRTRIGCRTARII